MIDTLFHQLATAFCLRSGGQPRTKRRNGGRRRECDDCGWSVPSLRSLHVCGPALVTLTISEPLRLRARKDVPLGILAAPAVHLWSAQPGMAEPGSSAKACPAGVICHTANVPPRCGPIRSPRHDRCPHRASTSKRSRSGCHAPQRLRLIAICPLGSAAALWSRPVLRMSFSPPLRS